MTERIFQHLNPVWKEEADFIIGVHVPSLGKIPEDNAWEQLWAKKVNNNHFLICCIPLFSYGLALGDEVDTNKDLMINQVIKPSGNETLRLWFHETIPDKTREEILDSIKDKYLIEWYSDNLLGINSENPSKTDLLIQTQIHNINNNFISIEIANR